MKHSKYHPLLIPLIVSVLEETCLSVFHGFSFPVVQVLTRLWKYLALGFFLSSRLHSAESLQQSKHFLHQQQIRQEKWKRHIGHFSNNKFVLGGWTTFGSCVCVGLVANCHLHGKPQALLVNSPVDKENEGVRGSRVSSRQVRTLVLRIPLTLCVLQLPGSRSPMSRRLFCLLSCGCWPRPRRLRRCSRRRPLRLSTGAVGGEKWKKLTFWL